MPKPSHPRLTEGQRLEIARARARGVPAQDLAARFGVSRQTIHATARRLGDAPQAASGGTRVVGVRVSDQELRRFDAIIGRHGLSRSEAIKRLMRGVGELFVAEGDEAERLKQLGTAINRVGGNVNQIAKACNEARLKGQPLPYTAEAHAEVREALALAFEIADQVRQLADSRRASLSVAVAATFREGQGE
jgi:Bacterial mobilisation protein (MobC)/Ribbon-helix-helix protein, copG family